jgi:hypothetical protein
MKYQRKKLDLYTNKCIFLGYGDERKWFRFLHKYIRIIVSRVVTFMESKQAQDSWVIN